jgi:transcriptional regulator with XRE-family HTH domain
MVEEEFIGLEANDELANLGRRIRELRSRQQVTLQALTETTGLSVSMISAVERGRANPSIGTLIAIAAALHVSMVSLFGMEDQQGVSPVIRREEQSLFNTSEGFTRRLLVSDRVRGIEMVLNEYETGAASNASQTHHSGFEFGLLLAGELEVHLNGQIYSLRPGDAVAFRSTEPHRTVNSSGDKARTVWINLYNER